MHHYDDYMKTTIFLVPCTNPNPISSSQIIQEEEEEEEKMTGVNSGLLYLFSFVVPNFFLSELNFLVFFFSDRGRSGRRTSSTLYIPTYSTS